MYYILVHVVKIYSRHILISTLQYLFYGRLKNILYFPYDFDTIQMVLFSLFHYVLRSKLVLEKKNASYKLYNHFLKMLSIFSKKNVVYRRIILLMGQLRIMQETAQKEIKALSK